jgi:hypothetical protein
LTEAFLADDDPSRATRLRVPDEANAIVADASAVG